jgi:endonuclease G, mitochondrial
MKKLFMLLICMLCICVVYGQFNVTSVLPTVKNTKILKYTTYQVAYDTIKCSNVYSTELLTTNHLNSHVAVRKGVSFKNDPLIKCIKVSDYLNSGYDKGHLNPSADNEYDTKVMSECFYVTNMVPQKHTFNAGIWEDLEKHVRTWGIQYDSLLVISGPILNSLQKVGNLQVPSKCYKIIYSIKYKKGIAFVIDANLVKDDIFKYKLSIADLNKLEGINFLYNIKDIDKLDLTFWK